MNAHVFVCFFFFFWLVVLHLFCKKKEITTLGDDNVVWIDQWRLKMLARHLADVYIYVDYIYLVLVRVALFDCFLLVIVVQYSTVQQYNSKTVE